MSIVAGALVGAVPPAAAQSPAEPGTAPASTVDARPVDVIKVEGRIDPVVADFVSSALRRAEAADAEVLVVQLDSPGSVLDPGALDRLSGRLAGSPVPVAVWIGPSGSVAFGGAVDLVEAADFAGMASGTSLGRTAAGPLRGTLGPRAALDRGVVQLASPTLGEFVVDLEGRQAGDRVLHTARSLEQGRRTAAGNVRFARLDGIEQLLHTAANPQVAYLLLLLGLLLVVFEFFTAGVGVAGGVGATALVLAGYGLAVLPTSGLKLALLALAMIGFAIDVQAGAPRVWTAVGVVCLVAGSWRLFGSDVALPLPTIGLVGGGIVVAMVSGMSAMLRARFATPTIGRESMVGRMGEAHSGIDPEGTVSLGGALWKARTNRATPIGVGEPVRVVAIEGLLLEVEPEEGGARDAGH